MASGGFTYSTSGSNVGPCGAALEPGPIDAPDDLHVLLRHRRSSIAQGSRYDRRRGLAGRALTSPVRLQRSGSPAMRRTSPPASQVGQVGEQSSTAASARSAGRARRRRRRARARRPSAVPRRAASRTLCQALAHELAVAADVGVHVGERAPVPGQAQARAEAARRRRASAGTRRPGRACSRSRSTARCARADGRRRSAGAARAETGRRARARARASHGRSSGRGRCRS